MTREFYCMMQSQVVLTEEMANVLFDTAAAMYKNDNRKATVKTEGMEGQVMTTFNKAALLWICGILFTAEVETDLGKGKISFIVRMNDLPENYKFDWIRVADNSDYFEPSSVH
jgi:hypothetical protein